MLKSISLILLTILVSSSIHLGDSFTTYSRDDIEDRPEQVPQWSNHRQHHANRHQEKLEDNVEDAPHDPTKLRILKRRHVRRQSLPTEEEAIRNVFGNPQWNQNQQPRTMEITKRQTNYQPNQQYSPPVFYQTNNVPGSQISNHIYPNGFSNGAYGGFGSFGLPFGIGFIPIYVQVPCNQNQQPTYLPPNVQRPSSNGTVPIGFPSRIDPTDSNDPPNWGTVDDNDINTPVTSSPPLQIDFDRDYFNTITGISLEPVRPLRPGSRPPPAILHGSNARPEERPVGNQNPQQSRPQSQRPQRPNRPPPPPSQSQPGRDTTNPLNCAYAVVSCCNNSNTRSRSECFTLRGCPGPFFDNPCTSELAKAAADFVVRFPNGQ